MGHDLPAVHQWGCSSSARDFMTGHKVDCAGTEVAE